MLPSSMMRRSENLFLWLHHHALDERVREKCTDLVLYQGGAIGAVSTSSVQMQRVRETPAQVGGPVG